MATCPVEVHMSISKPLKVILIASALSVIALSGVTALGHTGEQQPMGDAPPIIKGGQWIDGFDWGLPSTVTNTEISAGHLLLKLEEYLDWTQTWTAHFALGDFFHTEAVSDSVRLAPIDGTGQYFTTGIYTSTVFDAGKQVDWSSVKWTHSGTPYSVTIEYRTGDTPVPDGTWSEWHTPATRLCAYVINLDWSDCSSNMSGIESSRHIQYRASFNSNDPDNSIALFDIEIGYGVHRTTGAAVSESIPPVDLWAWRDVFYTATIPISTSLTVDILSADGMVLISNASSGSNLASIDPSAYPAIKLRATLTTDNPAYTPELDAWGVRWVVGSRCYLPVVLR
jgi:hypothetical protein